MNSPLVPPPSGSGLVFVTGAGGFLGTHTVRAYLDAGWGVGAFALRDATPYEHPSLSWFSGPVSANALRAAAKTMGHPELIIHAAGGSSVAASLADPADDFQRTVGSVIQVLDFMRSGAHRLLFLSSAAVYGAAALGNIGESCRPQPISPYGLHKALAEELVQHWSSMFGLSATIIRFFSIYGPGLRKQILWDLANRAAAGGVLELSGTGEEQRDFLHVDDALHLIGLVGAMRDEAPTIINGGSGAACTVRVLAETLMSALDTPMTVRFNGHVRHGDPRSLVACSKLSTGLGFQSKIGLEEGLANYARWFRAEVARTKG